MTGENYEHRKIWVVEKLNELSEIFAIEICAYAILSNHYHVILHVATDTAKRWNQDEVIERWRNLFGGGVLIERYLAGQCTTQAEHDKVTETAEIWRARLMDISWFMRCLNESIARQANKEDNCKGRFWEGRFKSQALLDERALLACMVYVDLNPIRAGMCETPEASDFTSIQQRLHAYQEKAAHNQDATDSKSGNGDNNEKTSATIQLNAFTGGFNTRQGIPFAEIDYFELTDWTGRAVHPKKKGAISEGLPSLLTRLALSKENWIETVSGYEKHFSDFVGQEARMKDAGASRGMKWLRGLRACQRLLSTSNNIVNGPKGELDWLEDIDNPGQYDFGFSAFINTIDALVMGRNTSEKVLSFGMWPYEKTVFVASSSIVALPPSVEDKAFLIRGTPMEMVKVLRDKGYVNLYIDGGAVIQSFLNEDLIDELILTTVPILLGEGISLFGCLPKRVKLKLIASDVLIDQLVKTHYQVEKA